MRLRPAITPRPQPRGPAPARLRGGSRAAQRACSKCGAPDSALGSARAFPPLCFKLRTGFFSCSWGGPGGSGAPSPFRRCPRVRPARPQPRRQVSESAPCPSWPAAPAPQAAASARLRAREAPNPGPCRCAPRPPGPQSPATAQWAPGRSGPWDGPQGRTGPLNRSPGKAGPCNGSPRRDQGVPDPRTSHRAGPDPGTHHQAGTRKRWTLRQVTEEGPTLGRAIE